MATQTMNQPADRAPNASNPPSNMDVSVESSVYFTPRTSPLRPLENVRRMFGKFYCNNCKRFWYSANAWKHCFQLCQTCRAPVRPTRLQSLIPKRRLNLNDPESKDPTKEQQAGSENPAKTAEAKSPKNSPKKDVSPPSTDASAPAVVSDENGEPKRVDRKSIPTVKYFVRHPKWLCEQCIKYGDCMKREDSCVPKYRRKPKTDKENAEKGSSQNGNSTDGSIGISSGSANSTMESKSSADRTSVKRNKKDKKLPKSPKDASKNEPKTSAEPSPATTAEEPQVTTPPKKAGEKSPKKKSPKKSPSDKPAVETPASPLSRADSAIGSSAAESSPDDTPVKETKKSKNLKTKKAESPTKESPENNNPVQETTPKKKNKRNKSSSVSSSPNSSFEESTDKKAAESSPETKSKTEISPKKCKAAQMSPASSPDDKALGDSFSGDSDASGKKNKKKNKKNKKSVNDGSELLSEVNQDLSEQFQNIDLDASKLEVRCN